jgi:CubicO group peptidase (beta-lactamase class C family)
MKSFLLTIPVIVLLSFQACIGQSLQKILSHYATQLQEMTEKDTTGSLSGAVFIGDSIVWSGAYGKADNGKGIAADTSTIYRIGSISKTFTAYLMMRLVQEGVIGLDDPVAKYLPEITQLNGPGASTITFRELASHTAGLDREPGLQGASSGPIQEWENKVLASIPTTGVHPPIGEHFLYSNIGFGILGLALSRAAHRPFMEMMTTWVFLPHRMTSSFYIIPYKDSARVATGYTRTKEGYDSRQPTAEFSGRGYKVPNGGIFTTPNDLARFLIAQTGDQDPLQKRFRDTMQTIQTKEKPGERYGFGLEIGTIKGHRILNHDGGVAGFNAFMAFAPKTRTGVILFGNRDDMLHSLTAIEAHLLEELIAVQTYHKS